MQTLPIVKRTAKSNWEGAIKEWVGDMDINTTKSKIFVRTSDTYLRTIIAQSPVVAS